ncbi:nucleotidyltransferase domain-containing protein [Proteus mirabilis]
MTVIFKYEPDQTIKEQFVTVQSVLEKNNPVISKIDFDCGLLEQVLDPDNVLSWGYWIKHHCHCVYGEDLSHHLQAFKPSKAIAVAVNGDFMEVLDKLVIQIKVSSNENKKLQLRRSAARKLIRATNILRSEQDNDWPDSLHEYRAKFNSRYPALAEDMDYLLEISIKPRESIADFEKRAMAFARWLSCEFNNQKV